MYRHWKSKVEIVQEVLEPLPRYDQCGIHMSAAELFNHRQTDKCNKVMEKQLRYKDVKMAASCGEMDFSLYGEEGG